MESWHIQKIRKSAENSFESGLYCAESVLLALANASDIKSELLPKIASGFCGGMARTCGTCGAVTGAIMGIGLTLGRSNSDDSMNSVYEATQRLISKFEELYGSRECHVLLGCNLGTSEGQKAFRENNLSERCIIYTGGAAEMAATIMADVNG